MSDGWRPARPADVEPERQGVQVEQDQIRLMLGELGQTLGPIGSLADLVALVLERQAQREADGVVVLDEQQRMHSVFILPHLVFVTENAQSHRPPVTRGEHDDSCSRCPGGVPSSPWRLTGSATLPHTRSLRSPRTRTLSPCRRRSPPLSTGHAFFGCRAPAGPA